MKRILSLTRCTITFRADYASATATCVRNPGTRVSDVSDVSEIDELHKKNVLQNTTRQLLLLAALVAAGGRLIAAGGILQRTWRFSLTSLTPLTYVDGLAAKLRLSVFYSASVIELFLLTDH